MNTVNFFESISWAFVENFLWYAIFAFPAFFIFWVIGKKYFRKIRIQKNERATTHHFKHDLSFSAISFLVFALMDVCFLYLESKGYTLIYFEVQEYGWLWLFTSFFLILFIDDTFFYWTHRAMHLPKLYRFFHKVHHESTDPSPLTAFAFHPSEAFVEQLMHVVLPFLLPLNFSVIIAWQIFSMLNNVLAHLGYEVYPKSWIKIPILKYKTASVHHNMHHERFDGNYSLYFTWWDNWMGTAFKDYEQKHQELFESNAAQMESDFVQLTVGDIRNETDDVFSLRFDNVPFRFRNFLPGQHVTIKVKINNETYYRTFSISSAPGINSSLTLTIKKIPNGIVTNFLFQKINPGNKLEVSLPVGDFTISPDENQSKHYILIAAGSGITPIYSMIVSLLKIESKSNVTLLYANRKKSSIIFSSELDKLLREFPENLSVVHFLSNESDPELKVHEKISQDYLEQLLHTTNDASTEFYICGPELFTDSIIHWLHLLGIKQSQIHSELFTTTSNPNGFTEKITKITSFVSGEKFQFDVNGTQTILHRALEIGIPLPYSCKSGRCGMCKVKCTKGKVVMRKNEVLTDNELAEGYILTCQSYPESLEIEIEKK